MIWKKAFWKGAAERAIKTFFQTFVAIVGVSAVGISMGLSEIDWVGAASISAVAAILSIATSIGNADFTSGEVLVVASKSNQDTYGSQFSKPNGDTPLFGK